MHDMVRQPAGERDYVPDVRAALGWWDPDQQQTVGIHELAAAVTPEAYVEPLLGVAAMNQDTAPIFRLPPDFVPQLVAHQS